MVEAVVPWINFVNLTGVSRKTGKKISVRIDDGPAEVRTSVFRQLDVGMSFSTMTTDQLEMLANFWNAIYTVSAPPEIARPITQRPWQSLLQATVFPIPSSANTATYCIKRRGSGAISWLVCVDIYLLTPWCRVLLEKLTGLQLVKKFPAFLWNPKVHHRTHKCSPPVPVLGQPNPVPIPTSRLLEIHPNLIHPSTPRSPQWSLSLRFPHQDHIRPPLLTHTLHMPSPYHSSRFYHPHNIGLGVQII